MKPFDPMDPNPEDLPAFQWPAASNFGKEMRRWDTPKSRGGMKPDGFERFPQMLYMARELPGSGRWGTNVPEPPRYMYATDAAWTNAIAEADKFNRTCQRIVKNEQEYARARDEGWRDSPTDALKHREALDTAISDAAAHRHFEDRKLSERAQAEARAVDEDSFEHVPEVTPAAVSAVNEKRRESLAKARAAKAAKAAGHTPAA